MTIGNGTCAACSQQNTEVKENIPVGSIPMNNNPIRMLFELGNTTLDALREYNRRGLLVKNEEKIDMRMKICNGCKVFNKESARCGLCGCFMKIKIRLEASNCPLGKW
jgi:hypothetical protein